MIKYIIYEDNGRMASKYIKMINKFMLKKNINYKILVFSNYNKEIENIIRNKSKEKLVYLLDVEVPGLSGVDLAREIRNNGDWQSQLIIITGYEGKKYFLLTNRLLLLTFILKSNINKELMLALDDILKIFYNDSILTFKYNGEIFNIFYNDIYYIEKSLHNNVATIYTKDEKYVIRSSINNLMKTLEEDTRFFKTHRSCIVNLNNVCGYNTDSNVIKFKNKEINLVSRNRKKEFIRLLMDKSNTN